MPGSRQRSMHSTSAHAGNPRPESADSIETGDYEACDHNDESRLQRKGTLVGPCLGKRQRLGAERRINHQKARIHHNSFFTLAHHFGEIRKVDTHCVYTHTDTSEWIYLHIHTHIYIYTYICIYIKYT